ncbi:g9597 [Coccomyxa viridis]|uniref:G9597 protein n=1 Tax=Coccomyxa viridis TaxID=1274662 RepID=A0ABP1G3Q3_9CHLO
MCGQKSRRSAAFDDILQFNPALRCATVCRPSTLAPNRGQETSAWRRHKRSRDGTGSSTDVVATVTMTATFTKDETPVTTQPALSLPAAGKKMCQPPRHCSWIVDEEGYSKEDCRPQRPTPPGFGNLCGDDIFTIVIFALVVILVVLIRCSW